MNSVQVVPASLDEYKRLLHQDFPSLEVNSIRYLGSGWDNAAMLVNEEYVFRFPRGLFEQSERIKADEIEKEVNILNYLHGKVSFTTPRPSFVAPGFRYFGYKLINGTLWDHIPENERFSNDLLRSWVARRSEFSKAVPMEVALGLKVPRYRTEKNEQLVKKFVEGSEITPEAKGLAHHAMEYVLGHLSDNGNWTFIHEDLQMSNCMLTSSRQSICGIIDWGEAEIGPVEAEFYFWSKYNNGLLEKVAGIQAEYDGTRIDIELARAIHQFYIIADFVDFTERGFSESAKHKWNQIRAYLNG